MNNFMLMFSYHSDSKSHVITILVNLCEGVVCVVPDETCHDGICRCGQALSCEGNETTPFCDAFFNQCRTSMYLDNHMNVNTTYVLLFTSCASS